MNLEKKLLIKEKIWPLRKMKYLILMKKFMLVKMILETITKRAMKQKRKSK